MKITSITSTDSQEALSLPLYHEVSAGFPSPAENYIEESLDLNKTLIKNPAATFFVRVKGESMQEIGILDQDILVVDRSLAAKNGTVIVAVINGEFTVKKICKKGKDWFLVAENKNYQPILLTKEMDFTVWGVVSYAIHPL